MYFSFPWEAVAVVSEWAQMSNIRLRVTPSEVSQVYVLPAEMPVALSALVLLSSRSLWRLSAPPPAFWSEKLW